MTTTTPETTRPPRNLALRAVREGMLTSQEGFARMLQEAGAPDASKQLVQRWESGAISRPHAIYRKALERVTGRPFETLGFSGAGGVERDEQPAGETLHSLSGVWLSRYEYPSSGRGGTFTGLHYVVLLHHGPELSVRSLPGASLNPDSPLSMDLTVEDTMVTGTWREQTAKDGYYRGATYHGAVQMRIGPTRQHLEGLWTGFGKDYSMNTGPWSLSFRTNKRDRQTLAQYYHAPAPDER